MDVHLGSIAISCTSAVYAHPFHRGIAKPGIALRSGRRDRWFKSSYPDHFDDEPAAWRLVLETGRAGLDTLIVNHFIWVWLSLVERLLGVQEVASSNLAIQTIFSCTRTIHRASALDVVNGLEKSG